MSKPKKKVPEVVEQFWKLNEDDQIEAVNDGCYDGHLEVLKCHSQMATVLAFINQRISDLAKIKKSTSVAVVEPQNGTVVPISLNLQSIAAHMDYRYAIIKDPSKAAGRAVVEIGFLILLVKKELPHGELEKWIEFNTNVALTWAKLCRRAAEKFCTTHGEEALLMLCNPSADNPPEEVKKAEQLMLEFTGGKGPTALLHNLGIKKRPSEADEEKKTMTREELQELTALQAWEGIINEIAKHNQDWALLADELIEKIDEAIWDTAKMIHAKATGRKI